MVVKSTPQILQRISIRWLPDLAYEDTDTIALNVGGYFIDLRITKKDRSLQWSRAGERIKVGDDPLTFRWTRLVDSMASTQTDEASFKDMPNGDDLEFGKFKNEGLAVDYEEVWRDVTPKTDGESLAWILQSSDGKTFLGKIGNVFIALRQSPDGSFAVRQDEWDDSSWVTRFEHQLASGPQLSFNIASVDSLLQKQQNSSEDKISIEGRDYIVRGCERF